MKNYKEIILVEDNVDDADLILRILKKYKLSEKTIHLINGEEVLDMILKPNITHENRYFPKLIILDIKMPKVDGFTVLEKLKSDKKTRIIPIVMFSSSAVEDDIRKAYERGANSYVVKPIDYDDFKVTIEQIINFWINVNEVCKF